MRPFFELFENPLGGLPSGVDTLWVRNPFESAASSRVLSCAPS